MEAQSQILDHAIWHQPESKRYFLIPLDITWVVGETLINNLDGDNRKVDLASIEAYENPPEVLEEFLNIAYKKLLKQSQEAFSQLLLFKQLRGEVVDATSLNNLLENVVGPNVKKSSGDSTSIDEKADILKDIDFASLQKMLPRLHEMATAIDKSVADKKEEPEMWIEVLNKHLFGDLLVSKKEKRKAKLKKSIDDSIAEGLRKRGIRPSQDFQSDK